MIKDNIDIGFIWMGVRWKPGASSSLSLRMCIGNLMM